jgi:hypothetical protein
MQPSRQLSAMLLVGAAAALTGLVAGYFVGVVTGPSLSAALVAMVALVLLAVAIAFQTGVRAGRQRPGNPILSHGQDALRQELDRSRRFGRSFVLMRFPTPRDATRGTSIADDRPDGELIGMMLRGIDRTWSAGAWTYALLPEATREAALQLTARLRAALPAVTAPSSVEYAEFPKDGLTAGALLANLRPDPTGDEAQPVRLVRTGNGSAVESEDRERRSS